jgi:hypothetical protein
VSILLLEDGSALAIVGIVAILVVCVLALALVAVVFLVVGRRERQSVVAQASPVQVAPATPRRESAPRARVAPQVRGVEIDVPTRHADAIIHALRDAGWNVAETGEVVATDEDEEGLTTIAVDLPAGGARPASGEEVH